MTAVLVAWILAAVPPTAPAPVVLAGAPDARKLCAALAPGDRLRLAGSALERGDAEARHFAGRERALEGRYQVTIPADRLRFSAYSAEDQVLALYRHALPATADGAVRLHLVEGAGLPVQADPATVRRILDAQRDGKLALRVTFALAEDEEAPCFHLAGAKAFTIAAEPLAWEYGAGDVALARGGQGSDRPLVPATQGARPRVEIGAAPQPGAARGLRDAVTGRKDDLERCYRAALDRDPWLDGAIVADLDLAGGGARRTVRIAADSVQDEALVTCVRDVLARVDVGAAGGQAFLPIHFALDPPRAGGGE